MSYGNVQQNNQRPMGNNPTSFNKKQQFGEKGEDSEGEGKGVIISFQEFEKIRNLLDFLEANIPANDATADLLTQIAECKNALDSKTEQAQSPTL